MIDCLPTNNISPVVLVVVVVVVVVVASTKKAGAAACWTGAVLASSFRK